MPAKFHVAPTFGVVPQTDHPYDGLVPNGYFEDDDAVWQSLLSHPEVGAKEGSCVRGAVFYDDASAATSLNVAEVHGLVLDVDEFPDGVAPTPQEIASRLGNHRIIVWTTYNSTRESPRYRVVLPLAQPVPRTRFRALWTAVNERLGDLVGQAQANPDRLGYLPRLPSESVRGDYRWYILDGAVFDWFREFGELEETPDRVALAHARPVTVDRSNWLPDSEAEGRARAYMREAHVGVQPGSRHAKLFEKSCQLWWDFALEPNVVQQLLLDINSRFTQPKPTVDVLREVEAGWAWTLGQNARPQTQAYGQRRQRPDQVTFGKLEEIGLRLRRRANQRELGDAMVKLARREAYCAPEDVLASTRSLARCIADSFPQCDYRQAASVFAHSLSLLRAQAGPNWPSSFSIETVANVILARQQEIEQQRQRRHDAEQEELAKRIFDAFSGKRSTPYSVDEMHEYAREHRCTVEELRRRLIVQVGHDYSFFLGGSYTPLIGHNPEVMAWRALAALEPFGIEVKRITPKGEAKFKDMKTLVEQYGDIAYEHIVDLSRASSTFQSDSKTMVFAGCPIRPNLRPERSMLVEKFLETFRSDALLDWLAFAPRLDHACRALYMWGPPDTGKSFLAKCLARLWTTGAPTTGEDLVASFNSAIAKCPLVFCDERLPDELRGREGTERFRYEIQATDRPLNAKFQHRASLKGSLRFILAANHGHMIEANDTLTTDDVEGIRQRLEVIRIKDEKPRDFLHSLNYEVVKGWIEDDVFAKHVLWLRDTRQLTLDRFGPVQAQESEDNKQMHGVIRFSGITGRVLELLYKGLVNSILPPETCLIARGKDEQGVDIPGISILLNMDQAEDYWQIILGASARTPSRFHLQRAAKALRLGTTRIRTPQNKRLRYHVLDISLFDQWLELNGADKEAVVERFQHLMDKKDISFILHKDDA